MHICIIGAGVAGVNAARYAIQYNFECTVFEQTGEIGGTWVYTDQVGLDQYGLPIHTSMYKDLRSNLPKEVMTLTDFPYSEEFKDKSYITQQETLDYIKNFAKHFDVGKKIKFFHHVLNVEPTGDNKWMVDVKNLKKNSSKSYIFDAIMICTGKNFKPNIPKDLKGIETFKGTVLHSHDYRKSSTYQKKNVLIIGAKFSGIDITWQLSTCANKVYLSHRSKEKLKIEFSENVIEKPIIEKIDGDKVIFIDGTVEQIDVILYCTGFLYYYPFLRNCKIEIKDNYVRPLYKEIINIEYPTMAFIGLPFMTAVILLIDLQNRFFISMLSGRFQLPLKEDMYKWLENNERFLENDLKRFKRHFHQIGWSREKSYFDDLTTESGLPSTPNYIFKIHQDRSSKLLDINYRDDVYYVIDNDNFQVVRK